MKKVFKKSASVLMMLTGLLFSMNFVSCNDADSTGDDSEKTEQTDDTSSKKKTTTDTTKDTTTDDDKDDDKDKDADDDGEKDPEEKEITVIEYSENGSEKVLTPAGWWLTTLSDDVKVEAYTSVVIRFSVESVGTLNWSTPNVYILEKEADGTWVADNGVARSDNWFWKNGTEDTNEALGVTRTCNWNWDNFLANLTGSQYTVVVTNMGDGTASVVMNVVGSDGNEYFQSYTGISVNADKMYVRLTGDADSWTGKLNLVTSVDTSDDDADDSATGDDANSDADADDTDLDADDTDLDADDTNADDADAE